MLVFEWLNYFVYDFRVSNFTVNEGRSRVLISKYLDIPNRHFDDLDITVYVIKQPTNGVLESSRDPGQRLEEFSFRLAIAEFVFYNHDGSDTLQVNTVEFCITVDITYAA